MANNNPILTDYTTMEQINQENDLTSIEVQRGIGSYFPILISLGVTLYGFYLFLQTIIDTKYLIYGTLVFLGVLLVYIEHHRAGLIADWLGSRLEKLVNKLATIPTIGFMVGIAITVLFIALDTWGAMQSADSIERMLVNGIVKNSEQYKIEDAKAKSGVNEAKAYQEQLREWRTAKSEHYNGCDASWRVPTYRTKNQQCKDKFTEAKPTAVNSTGGTIAIDVYERMEAKAKADVAGYRKMFFWVFLGFSILLNYFAMASLFNQYRKKRKELTVEVIDELTDRMELMNAEKINKLSLSTQAQKQKLEEKNIIDVEIEKETYNITIAKRAKALMRKKEIPLKIMNNENIMEQKKAGFAHNPFSSNQQNEQPSADGSSTYDFISEDDPNYLRTGEILLRLWNNGKVKAGDKLTPKPNVINTSVRKHTTAISKVYSQLVLGKYAELRGNQGYFALVDMGEIKGSI